MASAHRAWGGESAQSASKSRQALPFARDCRCRRRRSCERRSLTIRGYLFAAILLVGAAAVTIVGTIADLIQGAGGRQVADAAS